MPISRKAFNGLFREGVAEHIEQGFWCDSEIVRASEESAGGFVNGFNARGEDARWEVVVVQEVGHFGYALAGIDAGTFQATEVGDDKVCRNEGGAVGLRNRCDGGEGDAMALLL